MLLQFSLVRSYLFFLQVSLDFPRPFQNGFEDSVCPLVSTGGN